MYNKLVEYKEPYLKAAIWFYNNFDYKTPFMIQQFNTEIDALQNNLDKETNAAEGLARVLTYGSEYMNKFRAYDYKTLCNREKIYEFKESELRWDIIRKNQSSTDLFFYGFLTPSSLKYLSTDDFTRLSLAHGFEFSPFKFKNFNNLVKLEHKKFNTSHPDSRMTLRADHIIKSQNLIILDLFLNHAQNLSMEFYNSLLSCYEGMIV